MPAAYVTPELVRWSRERLSLDIEEAAKKLNVRPERLVAWEDGSLFPTFRQAENIAARFYVPFGYLFLSSPPHEELPLPDYRTIPAEPGVAPSLEFLEVLNDALQKQQWFRDYLLSEGAERLPFVGSYGQDDDFHLIAADIQSELGLNNGLRETTNYRSFLVALVRKVEEIGVVVLRSSIVRSNTRRRLNVEEFRGFSISDDIAPLIFINSRDAKAAQIFTLAHELAHIWIGATGISNPDMSRRSIEEDSEVERLCNQVAAESLLPRQEFLLFWRPDESTDSNLSRTASNFKVSNLTALRQAFDLDLIPGSEYWQRYTYELEQARLREDSRKTDDGSGDFYNSFFARNGTTFSRNVIDATLSGRLRYTDAARLLNVKVKTLPGISERLFGESVVGG